MEEFELLVSLPEGYEIVRTPRGLAVVPSYAGHPIGDPLRVARISVQDGGEVIAIYKSYDFPYSRLRKELMTLLPEK